MSKDASFELQVAIVGLLKANADLGVLVDGRIYDRVPADTSGKITAEFPYVSLGPDQEIPDDAECLRASEFILQIDAWSRGVGFPEVKRIARAIEDALNEVELELTDNAAIYFHYDGRRVFRDPDGLTSHAALTFVAGIEKL
ncbi:DUF3168 domain-containing protein [Rhizobium sp. VS19-DR104.2]|uniref:DUF3168 domain-containing protein n=1 Tax=unclassified Rhizobium TaxID=2613769 RepID=UPI001CC6B70A|nr:MULTISPECIES: DUF3168 domain-containing protein [unclassified Rhizobium]MBZ5760278.1 DUF3168 domain-containing protein [Rhizobium sp. VS19-DR96]MBZ5766878.1 DUF3168 domain-containing protein [Rhizobium sp. VS19-DR129.2]MBZ5773129.1 DUF3168 domain-containing protein [Rhizobium sp. VS19-DRK62.2]MBZ5784113.1 DUF3168 domain-containing protein [Rhizobium sp. VS19-DR121]MBZ5802473.1 DUF3168 domain-containing protein [Rhizobium sp. VS19-DR181]